MIESTSDGSGATPRQANSVTLAALSRKPGVKWNLMLLTKGQARRHEHLENKSESHQDLPLF